MKRFFQGSKIGRLLLIALLIRLVLIPLAFHSDLTTNSIWGIYAKEFGLRGYYDWLNFGNYARPEYPPLSTLLFLKLRILYEFIFAVFWKINVLIPEFPSLFIVWLDKFGYLSLLKLPGILGDLGIGYLIFRFTKSKFASSLYLFNPGVIYLSSVWGQTEAFVGFFALLSLYFAVSKNHFRSVFSFLTSILTKATFLPILPLVFIQFFKNKIKPAAVLGISTLSVSVAAGVGYFFTDHNFLGWMIAGYTDKFLTAGGGALPFINLNAFNFWGVIFGLERVSDKVIFLNAPVSLWAYGISFLLSIPVLLKFIRGRIDIYTSALLISFIVFMFMPNMHERYFYPVFLFFPVVLAKFERFKKIFFLLSLLFLINLYHWWWVPRVEFLVGLLDNNITVWILSALNLGAFFYLYGTLNRNSQS